jgi:hypothetical protein
MIGPGVSESSRGAREDQITCSNGGPGRPNHALQKGPGKWCMAMTRPKPSHAPRSEIRPKKLSDDSYVSKEKKQTARSSNSHRYPDALGEGGFRVGLRGIGSQRGRCPIKFLWGNP